MSTMKEGIVDSDTAVKIVDSPIPEPKDGEVLIKVIVSGTNPKDWKYPFWNKNSANTGDDIAGTIVSVGPKVVGFNKGDRVAAFHVMGTPGGSYAEYAIAPHWTTFHIPESLSYEEASTVPLAAYTAALDIFYDLDFPAPWSSAAVKGGEKRPLIVYGASTSVGAFGIKLASAANIHPLIAVGSKNSSFIESYLDSSKGDKLIDYTAHNSQEDLAAAITSAIKEAPGVKDGKVYDALDTVSSVDTAKLLTGILAGPPDAQGRKPRVAAVLPVDKKELTEGVDYDFCSVGRVHSKDEEGERTFGLVWGQAFARGLAEGWFTPHPHEVLEGGLAGLQGGLRGLKDGTVRAKKVIVRLSDTDGVTA